VMVCVQSAGRGPRDLASIGAGGFTANDPDNRIRGVPGPDEVSPMRGEIRHSKPPGMCQPQPPTIAGTMCESHEARDSPGQRQSKYAGLTCWKSFLYGIPGLVSQRGSEKQVHRGRGRRRSGTTEKPLVSRSAGELGEAVV